MKFRKIFILTIFLSVILITTGCGKKDVSFSSLSDKELEKILVGEEWVCTYNVLTDEELTVAFEFGKKGKLSMRGYYKDEGNLVFERLSGTWKIERKSVSPYAEKIASECNVTWIKDKFPYLKLSYKNDTRRDDEYVEESYFIVDNGKKGKDYKIMLCEMDFDMDEYIFDQKNPDSDDADELPHYFYAFENACDELTAFFKRKINPKNAKEISYEKIEENLLKDATDNYSGLWDFNTWGRYEDWKLSSDKTFVHNLSDGWKYNNTESGTWDVKKQNFTDEFNDYYITFYKDDKPYKCFMVSKSGRSAKTIDAEYATAECFDADFLDDEVFTHKY